MVEHEAEVPAVLDYKCSPSKEQTWLVLSRLYSVYPTPVTMGIKSCDEQTWHVISQLIAIDRTWLCGRGERFAESDQDIERIRIPSERRLTTSLLCWRDLKHKEQYGLPPSVSLDEGQTGACALRMGTPVIFHLLSPAVGAAFFHRYGFKPNSFILPHHSDY